MLVLTRKKDETILIGEDVAVTVRSISAEDVLLHVACSPAVTLHTTGSDGATEQAVTRGMAPAPPGEQATDAEPIARVNLAADQALLIGPDVKVTIEGLHFTDGVPTRLRLGIQAPRQIAILRKEIRDRLPPPSPPS